MGFKFRKSVKMGPVRVNLSKKGVGYSVGGKGFRFTKKAGGGSRTTTSIPGTGISYSKDYSKAKTTNKKKSSSTRASYSQSSNSSSQNGGCLKGFLWFLAFCFVIGLIKEYWKILLALSAFVIVVYVLYKVYKKKHTPVESIAEPPTDDLAPPDNSLELPASPSSGVTAEPAEQITSVLAEFETALQSIPRVEIPLSDPVPRHLLKDLPEYSFSNITRKTRLDSIFPLVFLDVETTGFAPSKCDILEVAAIKFDSGMTPVAAFTTLCKPKKPIPEEASAVNHITDEMVADAPAFSQIAPALTDFLRGCHMAGHNLDFDLRFIFAHGADLPDGVRFYDTLDLAHLTVPSSSVYNYKLDTVCRYYGIRRSSSHRALSDCYATSKLFSHLVFDKTSRQLDAEADILSELSAE